ncbi:LysR family transcriptional regulator [Ahrensia sp. AH-315-G08]|nr:LysR family transcriptional regulator [Ahrensia sp. AH-315-G08]
MDIRSEFDWRHVGLFVAVAEHGSLSAAARVLRVSQPTIGRAIQALEEELGVSLFSRHPRGLTLTEQGEELAQHGREMARAAAQFSLAAAGRSDDLVGTVRITASQVVATFVLPAILARMRREEPRVQVELVATDEVENLLYREADIAIRMVRPRQQELIARHVADMPMGIYASHAYLAAQTAPISVDTLDLHSLVGYDRSTLIIDAARELGVNFTRDSFAYRCDDQVACWHMVLAGAGIGFTSDWVARGDDRVVRILSGFKLGTLPVWLTSHSALKRNRRVRFVYDFLAKALGEM